MRNIFVCLTITISFRIVIEVFFEFKDGDKDEIFYLFLIVRKFLNICVILILTLSIKAVLEQVKTQQSLEEKLTKFQVDLE
jgi:Na+/H+ antiporter NhaC